MLKACKYCGKIHDSKFICDKTPKRNYRKKDKIYYFRNSKLWKRKRKEIKERDKYLCLICLLNKYNTLNRFTTRDLQVHHIKPLKTNWDLRLDNSNLITLCPYHHEMAEKGAIPVKELLEIVKKQMQEQIEAL